jgi:hypothetical protein
MPKAPKSSAAPAAGLWNGVLGTFRFRQAVRERHAHRFPEIHSHHVNITNYVLECRDFGNPQDTLLAVRPTPPGWLVSLPCQPVLSMRGSVRPSGSRSRGGHRHGRSRYGNAASDSLPLNMISAALRTAGPSMARRLITPSCLYHTYHTQAGKTDMSASGNTNTLPLGEATRPCSHGGTGSSCRFRVSVDLADWISRGP